MKTIQPLLLFTILLIAASCSSSSSSSMSLKDGITTKGENLSCEDVFVRISGTETSRKAFIYGEKVEVDFKNLEGFIRQNKEVKPGISLLVLSSKGDTVLFQKDLYENFGSKITDDPLDLTTTLNIGRPMKENTKYTLKLHLWDKRGNGTFDTQFDFTVLPNKNIKTSVKGLSFDKIYLYDQEGDSAITVNTVLPGQMAYIIVEGLQGFAKKDGMNQMGISLIATDKTGHVFFDEKDLIGDEFIQPEDLGSQVSANFIFNTTKVTNPVKVKLKIYDKLSDAQLNSEIVVTVKK